MVYYVLYAVLVACVVKTIYARRDTLLYAAALLIPLTQRMPSPIPFVGAPANLIALGLVVAAIRSPRNGDVPQRLALRGSMWLLVTILLFGLANRGISELTGKWYGNTFTTACQFIWYWLLCVVLFAATSRLTRDPATARKVILCCHLSITAQCGMVFVDILQGAGRATAFLVEPNRAGSYFASASALFLAYLLLRRGRSRWLYGGATIFNAAAMLNTLSRGGMLAGALAVTCVLLIFYVTGRKAMGTKMLSAIVITIVVVNASLFLPTKVIDRVFSTFREDTSPQAEEVELEASAAERVIIWDAAWKAFLNRPLGYGTQTFIATTFQQSRLAKAAHNIYLQFLVEYGIQGFLTLLWIVLVIPAVLLRRYLSAADEEVRCQTLSLTGWWIAHSVAHVFTNSFFNLLVVGQFWMMLACVLNHSAGRVDAITPSRPEPRQVPRKGVTVRRRGPPRGGPPPAFPLTRPPNSGRVSWAGHFGLSRRPRTATDAFGLSAFLLAPAGGVFRVVSTSRADELSAHGGGSNEKR